MLLHLIGGKAAGIKCFQCSSAENVSCSDLLIHEGAIAPRDCAHIFEAAYCIKMTGYAHGGRDGPFACGIFVSATDLSRDPSGFRRRLIRSSLSGRIGTKRDCSSVDRGNYCNYVQLTGDQLEYRSCYFTCTGDGCNSGPSGTEFSVTAFFLGPVLAVLRRVVPF